MGALADEAAALGVPWYWVPGKERYAKLVSSVPDASSPGSGYYWPVVGRSKFFKKFIAGNGPSGLGAFGYKRPGGRAHAGTDLAGRPGDTIVAVTDGTITAFNYFYSDTWALFVNHGSFTINYGEVDGNSLRRFNLTTPYLKQKKRAQISTGQSGSVVKAGQPIAMVGRLASGSSMLHFEVYSGSVRVNKRWTGFPDSSPPSGLLNSENFLLALAGKRVPKKEVKIAQSPCR